MQPVTIYTTAFCPYCTRALKLFRQKKVQIKEIAAGFNAKAKAEMIQRAGGRRTFPQIFVGDTHVGGCDELMALDASGKLDPLLTSG
ncbi:MAG: glutaredoxin 3 [Robiginitomaculum sp.]|nr:MAG: glutaredoxin 3 [Robiginitomaculum sp.]